MTATPTGPVTELAIEHVSKSYGDKKVLDGVHVKVNRGELVSLLGPSGCGKTTTLNIVGGFVAPDTGRVLLGGTDVTGTPPYRRDTAVVFQNYALFPHMKVFDNVAYGPRARKLPRDQVRQRVEQTLDRLNIGELAGRYPGQLSGGQQQRVAVARAVAVHPTVLLMDEPLSNLDAKLRAEIRLELRSLQRSLEQTILFVTHDQEEALSISDRLAVLNEGRIEQYGTPVEIFEQPRTVFVADFMGVENIFAGTGDGGRWRTDGGVDLRFDGTGTHVGIRPSAVGLAAAGPGHPEGADGAGTHLPVTVEGRVYLGDTVRYQVVHVPTGTRIVAVRPRSEPDLAVGGRAVATLPAPHLLGLRDTPAPDPAGENVTIGAGRGR